MTDAAGRNATRTLLIGGVALVAVAALVAFVVLPLLTGEEPVDEVAGDPPAVVDPQPDPTPTPTQEPVGPDEQAPPPVETFQVFTARDPFQQLVDDRPGDAATGGTTTPPPAGQTTAPPPAGGTTAPPPTDGSDGTAPPPADGTGSTDGVTGPPPAGGNNDSDGSATVGGTTVTVVGVFTDDEDRPQATITVNGTGYTVSEGQTFAQRFRLLDISGSCATMLFGDSRFTLCEGERIRK